MTKDNPPRAKDLDEQAKGYLTRARGLLNDLATTYADAPAYKQEAALAGNSLGAYFLFKDQLSAAEPILEQSYSQLQELTKTYRNNERVRQQLEMVGKNLILCHHEQAIRAGLALADPGNAAQEGLAEKLEAHLRRLVTLRRDRASTIDARRCRAFSRS